MPRMLAAEHMSFVNALRFGTTRNQATILAALASIGSSTSFLVFTMAGDGVWTLSSNLTTPANVIPYIPPGVSVNIPAGVTWTCNGLFIAYGSWKTGTGTFVKSAVSPTFETSNMLTEAFTLRHDGVGTAWSYLGTTDPAAIRFFLNDGAGGCGLAISRNEGVVNSSWQMRTVTSGDWVLARPGSGSILTVNNIGLGIGGAAPSHALQLFTDDAFKATSAWSTPSDAALKTLLGDYTDGLATIRALPQIVRFAYNGLGGTPSDGKEQIGMIANDVQPVAPYMISSYQDRLEPDDPNPTTILSMNNGALVYMLINAVKELDTTVQELDDRLSALETP